MNIQQNPGIKEEEEHLEESNNKTQLVSASDDEQNVEKTLENNVEQTLEYNVEQTLEYNGEQKDEQTLENNSEQTLENNDKQIVLYIPPSSSNNDDDVCSGMEIVPVSVSDLISAPDPIQCRPILAAPRVLPSVGAFTVQCAGCFKWRLIPNKEKYEEIREHILDQPFTCDLAKQWRPDISCDIPADIEQDGSRLWAIDKPNIAQPPLGWERQLRIRAKGGSKFADVYYISPTGKRLRSMVEVDKYLVEHPEFDGQGATRSQFSFQIPKPLQENYVRKRASRSNPTSGEPVQASPISWAALDDPTTLQLPGPSLSGSFYKDSSDDVTPPSKAESRSSSKHTLSSDSFHNQPKRFKIKGPSPPTNEVYEV